MKKNGKPLRSLFRQEMVVFPRGDKIEDYFTFIVRAVEDIAPFRKAVTLAKPPYSQDRNGNKEYDYEDKKYLARREEYNQKFEAYYLINSIFPHTEWLEFEKVKLDDPDTWCFWKDEMREAGLSQGERDILVEKVKAVNALDYDSIETAMATFLAMLQAQKDKELSLKEGQGSTTSSEPASDSESFQQESESQE